MNNVLEKSDASQVECPLCGDKEVGARYAFRDPDEAFEKPLQFACCSRCQLVYLTSRFDPAKLYNLDYYGKRGGGLPTLLFEAFNRFWVNRKARRLARNISGNRWLDFGCGRGDFLKSLKTMGYEVWGLETQPEALRQLKESLGSHAVSRLDEIPVHDGFFDAITMWHVLEHLDQPRETLLRLARLTRPDGRLFLAVPNWDSWERQFFGDRWFHLDVPRHCLQFSETTLKSTLSKTGWRLEKIRYDSWSYNLFGLFQTLLNLGPGPRNLFYNVCKRGARPGRERLRFAIGALWTLLAGLPIAVVSFVAIIPITLLRKSGTIEVIASKTEVPQ